MENERASQAGVFPASVVGVLRERLVLASASPRRAEILRAVGWEFETAAANIDETARAGEDATRLVERLAREKAEAVARARLFGLVVGADTVVVVDDSVLGKPRDDVEARRMLRLLRGGWHEVLTGVALVRAETQRTLVAHKRTRVRFSEMSDAEIDWYVQTGEPADKAGAYAVQGRAALFIEEIAGDYWNVVGLPVRLVYELSKKM
ncbi:MAG: nucleoside triphosphate pyrophosphatase [Acidobacteriota bacterium]|jgi:septum formation protein|nr:nucleoside triphosphate pyrophosphatase [Acidobacteriota bacterium]